MSTPITIVPEHSFLHKIQGISWGLIILITMLACVGFTALYSAAGGSFSPWAYKQMVRFVIGIGILLVVALIDVRWWYRLTWPFYIVSFILLIIVEVMGHIGMGAQRWINLGFIQVQPSELMKIAVVMALARYFHSAGPDEMKRLTRLTRPAAAPEPAPPRVISRFGSPKGVYQR